MKCQKCSDIVRNVPISDMQKGIDLCKQNIADYLSDGRLIIKKGRPYHAVISVEFALEEFGKLLLIKEALKNPVGGKANINGKRENGRVEFCDHDKKVERALLVVDRQGKYRTIFRIWEEGMWEKGIWDEPEINSETRLECAFIDYKNNDWSLRTNIDGKLLNAIIDQLEAKLAEL